MDNIVGNITKHVRFRLIDAGDADFVLDLRTDPVKSRFISFTENDIDAQKKWIASYKEREKEGLEYYFIIEDYKSKRYGTLRLYDFRGDSFCWGSWLMKQGSPYYVAIESSFMACEIGFYLLGFCKSHGDVRKGNDSVLNYHLHFGGVITGEDELSYYLGYTRERYEEIKKKCMRFFC
ncbi:MAG TPA: GNAT family N-acetyltransferase [Chlorobaculum sp.]|jgi:hypothetical protein|uniref:GNAT family N-acetyltransferase n=1 Tax=Chlorobium sp. TaxID=1095 RepID=UPI001EB0EF92|nr:GNAT family N-acetyltransferase [Chlorobiaceae bacterium]HWQ25968.1 GNAT family N-acetyltransferase [Chlorobaculum sp.]